MLAQDSVLDKSFVILLVDRYEHAHNVAHQVSAAFWHAIKENRLEQALLNVVLVQLVEIVSLGNDPGHKRAPLAKSGYSEAASI